MNFYANELLNIRCSIGILILKYQDSIEGIRVIIFPVEDVSIIDLFH